MLLAPVAVALVFAARKPAAAGARRSSPLRGPFARRHAAVRAQAGDDLGDGAAMNADGGTFFTKVASDLTTLDGRAEDGASPEFVIPPGEDLIEEELRRLFDLEEDEGGLSKSGEAAEIALMFKLRKELGDEDFARIFEDPRITGQTRVRKPIQERERL